MLGAISSTQNSPSVISKNNGWTTIGHLHYRMRYISTSTGITMMLMLIIERNKQFVCDAHFCAETQSAESTTSHSSSFCINAEVYTATFEMLRLPTKFFFGLNQNQKPSHFTQRLSAPLISDIIPCVVFCILFVSRFPPRY